MGYVGSKLLLGTSRRFGEREIQSRIGVVALAIFAYGLAEVMHGNGLIACFVAGLASSKVVARRPQLASFADAEGKLLTGLVFFLVGAQLLPGVWEHINLSTIGFAFAALTIVRMIPTAFALLGTRLPTKAVITIGWFGPRGVATIVFALLVERVADWDDRNVVLAAAVTTVALSILMHGMTALPAVNWLSKGRRSNTEEST